MIKPVESEKELLENLQKSIEMQRSFDNGIYRILGFELESVDFESRSAVYSHIAGKDGLNFSGNMHGGSVCWLADTCMGTLAHAYGKTDNPTIDLNVNFIKGICPGDKLLIRAAVNHVGGHIIATECKIYIEREDGNILAATASGNFYRLNPQ